MAYNKLIILIAGLSVALISSSCILSPSDMYMADYEIRTPAANLPGFQEEFKRIGSSIAVNLDRNYVKEREDTDYFIFALLIPKSLNKTGGNPNVGMEWYRQQSLFEVTITTGGPEESADVVKIRGQIESILEKNGYKWKFSVQRRRTIFY